jgi:tetratricopeptide (TPR) repeat protein
LYLALSYEENKQTDKAILTYLKTFQVRPCRAEPLIKLAELYYKNQDYALAFLFAKQAITIPFPMHENIGVEKYWYDVIRYQLVGATAYLFQEYELGKKAVLQALQHEPNSEYLRQLLQKY